MPTERRRASSRPCPQRGAWLLRIRKDKSNSETTTEEDKDRKALLAIECIAAIKPDMMAEEVCKAINVGSFEKP